MSAFDFIMITCFVMNTIFFLITMALSSDIFSFLRSFFFILFVVVYIVLATIYIIVAQLIERMYE